MKGNLLNAISNIAEKNGRIVGGIAIVAGVFVTAALAYKARPKVDKIVEVKKEKVKEINENEDLNEEEKEKERKEVTKETVKEVAKVAAPAILSALATSGITVATVASGEKAINKYMQMAMVGDIAYKELYDKTRAIVGDEKADEIRKEIEEDHLKEGGDLFGPGSSIDESVVYDCGGPHLFLDYMSGRLFKCSESRIREAAFRCNDRMTRGQERSITMNDFYNEVGLPSIGFGDDRQWSLDSMADVLDPNITNTIRCGEGSATVLDWYTRPFTKGRYQ